MITLDQAQTLDRDDPLAPQRALFRLPDDEIYLDGNSLGPVTDGAALRVREVLADEWRDDLIRSWNVNGWMDLPAKVGNRIARLIGAHTDDPAEVMVADSTSVDLFKLLSGALGLRPERRLVVSEEGNFPTDLYMIQGLLDLLGRGHALHRVPTPSFHGPDASDASENVDPSAPVLRLLEERGDEVAVVVLTQVNYKTGAVHDMGAVTRAAHGAGALVLWDLAHSAGALPVDLNGVGADLAIGCGYKFLNGGPGAPAFLYVARRHQEAIQTPLPGWLGHAAPFDLDGEYRPAPGVARFRCGTPPVLSLAALDGALDAFDGVDMAVVREKSRALGDLFVDAALERCAEHGLVLACPQGSERRGSQVSFAHPEGYAIVQALIARGVVGDFRTPDVLRFGLAPLYLRYADVWHAARHLGEVLESGEWDQPQFRERSAVT